MLIEILRRTPSWVFTLLFALVVLGYSQTRDRIVSWRLLPLLPAVMIVLSLYGVLSAFGLNPLALVAWALGIAIAAGSGRRLAMQRGVVYSVAMRTSSCQDAGGHWRAWCSFFLCGMPWLWPSRVGCRLWNRSPSAGS